MSVSCKKALGGESLRGAAGFDIEISEREFRIVSFFPDNRKIKQINKKNSYIILFF